MRGSAKLPINKSTELWDELLLSNRVLMQDMTMGGISLASAPAESPPETIGLYKIKRWLGRGGMADVYLAKRTEGDFHQQVALKAIRKEILNSGKIPIPAGTLAAIPAQSP